MSINLEEYIMNANGLLSILQLLMKTSCPQYSDMLSLLCGMFLTLVLVRTSHKYFTNLRQPIRLRRLLQYLP
jgi:multisubunit Na+/H+ antiporter MnhE subunit